MTLALWAMLPGDAREAHSLSVAKAEAIARGDDETAQYLEQALCRLLRGIAVCARERARS